MTSRPALACALAWCACSSAPPAPETPAPPVVAADVPADAAVDAAPDAGPSEALATAPAWVFRFASPQRTETWTLRTVGTEALLDVETAQGTRRYLGTATDGAAIALELVAPGAKLALECKRARRAIGARCNDTKAPKLDVLDCYHADFKEPMPFGPAPGIEYADSASCKGYRLVAP